MKSLHRENQSLPEKGLAMVRLQREVGLQESLYSQLKAKYQEVQIQESSRWRSLRREARRYTGQAL